MSLTVFDKGDIESLPLFYGVKDVYLKWNGEWNDPDLYYHGERCNYYDIENTLYDRFKEDSLDIVNDDGFSKWVLDNPQETYDLLDTILHN